MESTSRLVDESRKDDVNAGKRKTPRKSRSRGLRTKTGCITCRKRHKKCNEVLPICGNCTMSGRTCVWPDQRSSGNFSPTLQQNTTAAEMSQDMIAQEQRSPPHDGRTTYLAPEEMNQPRLQMDSPFANHVSPSNTVSSEFLTADLASVRWLDLLAADAVQANRGFTRPSSPVLGQLPPEHFEARVNDITALSEENFKGTSERLASSEGYSWQLENDIVLKNSEVSIFRNFVERSSLWLDIFDPHKHFSVYAVRLALRNVGLMKAILALSAQHLSRQEPQHALETASDPNLAIEYYYETLHYVQTALQYNSYAHSEELLATALIISTYEMLDESDSGWQRHLKGVFWIQRSQDVNGASGGIRQAVWWAWLRQDIWAAFKERRRCFSFWKPVQDYSELSHPELVDRIIYLFSQAVNYCADPTGLALVDSVERRTEAADELLAMLDRWRSFLGEKFKPLPVSETVSIFQPIWIHPPQLGVALQVFYFARILITLHRPAISGFSSYMKVQKSLSEAVTVICGIAMQLTDEGCQIISSQCLYGAGLCVQEPSQRNEIISLISACEARTGWPMSTLREDLRREWKRGDSDGSGRDKKAQLPP